MSTCTPSNILAIKDIHLDVLRELINIGTGQAANMLNQMTSTHVELRVPEVCIYDTKELLVEEDLLAKQTVMAIRLGFDGFFSGLSVLFFPVAEASKLVSILIGSEPPAGEMESLRIGALQEVGNIVLNGVMGSIANALSNHFTYLPPDHFEVSFEDLLTRTTSGSQTVLFARTSFLLEKHVIEGHVIILFEMSEFDKLLGAIDHMLREKGMLA